MAKINIDRRKRRGKLHYTKVRTKVLRHTKVRYDSVSTEDDIIFINRVLNVLSN